MSGLPNDPRRGLPGGDTGPSLPGGDRRPSRWRQVLVYFGLADAPQDGRQAPDRAPGPWWVAFTFGVFVLGFGVANGDWTAGLIAGVVYAVIWSLRLRSFGARRRVVWDAAQRGAPIPGPPWVIWWRGRSLPTRRVLAGASVVWGAFLLWLVVMAFAQESTCDPTEGGLVSSAQHGFTRAYCGAPDASSTSVVVNWILVGALPLLGLLVGIAAVVRDRKRRGALLGAGASTIVIPMLVAWLLAGAH